MVTTVRSRRVLATTREPQRINDPQFATLDYGSLEPTGASMPIELA
jgi:hypothetical protein